MTGIAIVGLACEYPDAHGPEELWDNVLAGRRAFRRIPRVRLDLADYHGDRSDPDRIYSEQAAVLDGWELDRVRFRVAGSTYRAADPAHWLALDVAARALESAGFGSGPGGASREASEDARACLSEASSRVVRRGLPRRSGLPLPRATTGVVVGNTLTGEFSRARLMRLRWPYVRRVLAEELVRQGEDGERIGSLLARLEVAYKEPFPENDEESLAGGLSNTIAGRIANHFDLGGGAFTVDGACASSLLSVCQACSALAAGDLDVALAGGVDLSLDPFELVGFARTGALAPGKMYVYDERSAGFIPGEGCGFVVLMREQEATEREMTVLAVIRGWGISSDGAGGITRPEASGQRLALERAYRRSGFGIDRVGCFEGHGTGTTVGDAVELEALGTALAEAGGGASPVPIGSIKALIGHTKAAAGAAALIKAVLAVHHQVLPPHVGGDRPHPLLAAPGAPLTTLPKARPWPRDRPLVAAVSAMGFGGINTHVVLEAPERPRRRALTAVERGKAASIQDAELLLLAGEDAADLARQVERLRRRAAELSLSELTDLTAALARELPVAGPRRRLRAAVVAADPKSLAEKLASLAGWLDETGGEEPGAPRLDFGRGIFLGSGGRRRVGFLFPGQASPARLGGGLWARRFEEVHELYRAAGLPTTGDGVHTTVAQPAIVTAELAGLALLDRLGISADVAVGHSLGELTALAWAGAWSEAALLEIARARGEAMAALADDGGAMAGLEADGETVAALVGDVPGLHPAGFNSPRQTVVSGPAAAVETALERARERGLEATRLQVSHAFHSPLVAAAAPVVSEAIRERGAARLERTVVSTVTGAALPADADLAELLGRQVTSPVRFTEAVAAAEAEGIELWIEVGPGRVLSGLAADAGGEVPAVALDAGGESLAGLLAAAGAAFALGAPVDPEPLFEGRVVKPFDPDREPRFLVNPCELAPRSGPSGDGVEPGELPRVAEIGEPAPPPAAVVPPARDGGADPFELVRGLVAERSELPPETVTPETRLLSDLHLSSISVGQLVGEASRRLGVAPPASPTDYADASVGELARVLALREAAEPGQPTGPPSGLDAWVRAFAVEHLPAGPAEGAEPAGERSDGAWTMIAAPGHALAELEPPLAELLGRTGRSGVALLVPDEAWEDDAPRLLAAARAVLELPREPEPPVLLVAGAAGGGFARTLHLEHPEVAVLVAEQAAEPRALERLAAEVSRARGYREVRIEPDGSAAEPYLVPLDLAPGISQEGLPLAEGALPLAPDDLLLVTGGGKGIGAECALALARASGAKLLLLGRSRPEDDAELAANLARMEAAGLTVRYAAADVLDAEAVAAAVRQAEEELGPVRGVLHSAGFNHPRRVAELTAGDFAATLAPKLAGLDHVLAAVDPAKLSLLVTFGSIIARLGLPGEADYATANQWLARRTARFGGEHPGCRCLCLEWSVWSGVGMGERLGRLEALRAADITPIPPEVGVSWLLGLLAAPAGSVPPAVVVAGRFGLPPTLRLAPRELPFLRFLDRPRVHYPGVELVADVELSADTDPYLAEHELHGERLFPAVLGLEAMVQAAMAVAGTSELPVLEDVRLTRPVVVPAGETALVRLAALARSPGVVEVALRTAATAFAVDHFRARCDFRPGDFRPGVGPAVEGSPAEAADELLPLSPAAELYGSLLFQQGRFRRLAGYRSLSARELTADVAADGAAAWFAHYLPGDLVLGDPGARDAVLHGLQASIPHAQVLPVGVERLWIGRLDPRRPHRFAARERWRRGDDFLYDIDVLGEDGRLVERWQGLALRAVERLAAPAEWRVPLLGPYLERSLEELAPGSVGKVLVERAAAAVNGNGGGREASDRLLARLAGGPVRRRPDGKPEAGSGVEVSLAHAAGLLLGVAGSRAVGCDVEPVAARSPEAWADLLGAERSGLARLIAREGDEELDAAATRVWAAVECLRKAGASIDAPLVLTPDGRRDGWLLLSAAGLTVGTLVTRVEGVAGPVVLALAGSRVAHEVPRTA